MEIKILAFGIAKDILQNQQLSLQLEENSKIIDLKNYLLQEYPQFAQLKSLSFAVETEYKLDDFMLNSEDEVVIIPPVSGG